MVLNRNHGGGQEGSSDVATQDILVDMASGNKLLDWPFTRFNVCQGFSSA